MGKKRGFIIFIKLSGISVLLLATAFTPVRGHVITRTDILGPTGSGVFGETVTVLTNGNFVVVDSQYTPGGGPNQIGAVYLYNGDTLALISTLTGSQAYDAVGAGGVTQLSNGNFVVTSLFWSNGTLTSAGAITWCSGITGCNGEVSASNSLVGMEVGESIGFGGVNALSNGNYVVNDPFRDNGSITEAGAVTWCSGMSGCIGETNASNSLMGSHTNDMVGSRDYSHSGIFVLSNGNYVVASAKWDNGAITDAGAVTFCRGAGGCQGTVSPANSMVGSQTGDRVGYGGLWGNVIELANGNYVVNNPYWHNDSPPPGAVTWCSGTSGCQGPVSADNSVVGAAGLGDYRLGVLTNGNFVVWSSSWNNGSITNVGAARWCSGTSGCNGPMTPENSLVGSQANDGVGLVEVLTNGNYVVRSPRWDNGAIVDVGAVTWCSGTGGCVGPVTETNSLVGSHTGDDTGDGGPYPLLNGNYVVLYPYWDNGIIVDAGAARWCSGLGGCTGPITQANALVGTTTNERVGLGYFTRLANGNYVLSRGGTIWCNGTSGCTGPASSTSRLNSTGHVYALSTGDYVVSNTSWDNGPATGAGAVTWCSGTSGCSGEVTAANSLVGSTTLDQIGEKVTVLPNGGYAVYSQYWDNGSIADAGSVTWCDRYGGCTGVVSATNSLVGSQTNDQIGSGGVYALTNGSYVVMSPLWYSGTITDAGAITWADNEGNTIGPVSELNSVTGEMASQGGTMFFRYDAAHLRLFVSHPADNTVTVLSIPLSKVYLPLVLR
jgi:hypothetical protein